MHRQWLLMGCLASFMVLGFVISAVADTTIPDTSKLSPRSDQDMAVLTSELRSGDNTQIDQALEQIKEWVGEGHTPAQIYHDWVPALIAGQRYHDAADLALTGALARPDIRFISQLMFLRARALLALGDSEQALEAAKSYYNVCFMKNTPNAIKLMAQCLTQAHPDDADISQRFINEQSTADGTTPDAAGAQSATQPTATSILQSIQIDPTLYADALNKWKAKTVLTGNFDDFASYANVLLVADQADQAEKIFETLYKQATTQDDLNSAIEGIARSMRAEDGNVDRANTWLLSLQKQSSSPPAAAPQ
jgi:tetratricopeptide (TPR) repeat protein